MSSDPVPQTRHDVCAFRASWFMLAYFPRPAPLRAHALRTCCTPHLFLSLHADPLVGFSPFPRSMQKTNHKLANKQNHPPQTSGRSRLYGKCGERKSFICQQ